MATKREYLVSLGLAKEGRGKFSNDALAALAKAESEGVKFDEPVKAAPKPKKVSLAKPTAPKEKAEKPAAVKPAPVRAEGDLARPIKPQKALRAQTTMYAVSPIGRTHVRIGYDTCFAPACNKPVQYCACPSGPRPPAGAIPVSTYPSV